MSKVEGFPQWGRPGTRGRRYKSRGPPLGALGAGSLLKNTALTRSWRTRLPPLCPGRRGSPAGRPPWHMVSARINKRPSHGAYEAPLTLPSRAPALRGVTPTSSLSLDSFMALSPTGPAHRPAASRQTRRDVPHLQARTQPRGHLGDTSMPFSVMVPLTFALCFLQDSSYPPVLHSPLQG